MTTLTVIYAAIGLIVFGLTIGRFQIHQAVLFAVFWPFMVLAMLSNWR